MRRLFATVAGRVFLASAALLIVLSLVERGASLPPAVELVRRLISLAFLSTGAWIVGASVVQGRRRLLWRVRRKLILSYFFVGFVPVVLVLAFVLAGSALLYMNIADYVFTESFADTVANVREMAETSAIEIGRDPGAAAPALARKYANLAPTYPDLSLALVVAGPAPGAAPGAAAVAGPWGHTPAPAEVPAWVVTAHGFSGTIAVPPLPGATDPRLVVRAIVATRDPARLVVADLPVDAAIVSRLRERTGMTVMGLSFAQCGSPAPSQPRPSRGVSSVFRETIAFVPCTDWATGKAGAVSVDLDAPVGMLASRLAAAQPAELMTAASGSWWTVFVYLLVMLSGLFLVVQGAALVMGWVLAKSITSAVHELFVGTERVQQGDFAHRIAIESDDQLGALAGSFNRMSESIEVLLAVQRDKQRLDDELRIAREIQYSLLPARLPAIAGIDVAAQCRPAREVGGDYYDFFTMGPRSLAIVVADVSGKGTSAALYMAELKGLMLALSEPDRSPRQLLLEVSRRLAGNLDSRSFVTMTYAVVDLDLMRLTVARAGHTPLIVVSQGTSEIIVPDGMVVGLDLPGAQALFEGLLVEYSRPLACGDIIALYTDGLSEAMDGGGDFFGDERLAEALAGHRDRDAHGVCGEVWRDVEAFAKGTEQHDDMTMVIVKLTQGAAADA